MQVQRVQNNNNYNTNFGAKIIKTDYLEAGLKYAKEHASIRDKDEFLNALRYIANDTDMTTFSIKAAEGSKIKSGQARKSIIEVNGKQNYSYGNEGFMGSIYDGPQCVSAVTDFVKRHYGFDNAVKAFKGNRNQWLKKVIDLQHQIDVASINARRELNNGLDELMTKIKADK